MRILIHNSSLSTPLVFDNGISLSPGFNYDIKVSRTYHSRLAAPYSSCLKDLSASNPDQSVLMQIMFNVLNLTTYNQQYCQNLAFQTVLAEYCGCVNPSYPSKDPNFPKCINGSQVFCHDDVFQAVFTNPDIYFGEMCPKGKISFVCFVFYF